MDDDHFTIINKQSWIKGVVNFRRILFHTLSPYFRSISPLNFTGPCAEGLLVTASPSSPLLGECRCDPNTMGDHYWGPGASCHEHYSTGPCQERGGLFLPGGLCGCSAAMPHFHNATSRCYQLGKSKKSYY